MESQRLKRLMKLLNLLQSGHITTSCTLASALGCSRRTVFRDIRLLNQVGVSAGFARERGAYAVDSQKLLLTCRLEEGEYIAILVAALVSPLTQTSLFTEKVNQGIAKLLAKAHEPVRKKVTNLLGSIVFEMRGPDHPEFQERVFEPIIVALCEREQLRVYYRVKGKKHAYCTKIAPYRLMLSDKSWKLTARSSIHRRVVQFDLAEIEKIETTGDHYFTPVYYLQSGHNGSKRPHAPPASAYLHAMPSETE